MSENDLALKMGLHILNSIKKMQDTKKDFGQELIIPFNMPGTSNEPDFMFSIKLQMPRFSQINLDGSIISITMAEYYEWSKCKQ
jgi:hypothetical protein